MPDLFVEKVVFKGVDRLKDDVLVNLSHGLLAAKDLDSVVTNCVRLRQHMAFACKSCQITIDSASNGLQVLVSVHESSLIGGSIQTVVQSGAPSVSVGGKLTNFGGRGEDVVLEGNRGQDLKGFSLTASKPWIKRDLSLPFPAFL